MEDFICITNYRWKTPLLLFNLIVSVTSTISGSSATYYCKWIFGNDNLVAIVGAVGMLGTIVGFLISTPMIKKFGARNSILIGLAGSALFAGIRCLAPENIVMYAVTGALGSGIQIPLMCLYGVIAGYAVDYNEYKYDKKMVAISSGAVSFGSKVGSGVGTIILSGCLSLSAYDATPKVGIAMATTCVIPENESVEAIEKAYNATYTGQMGTMGNAWFCDPMLKGESVTAYGIYRTSKKDLDEIFQPLDFVGINTYSPMEGGNYGQGNKNQKPGCSRNSMGWLVDEGCLYWTIRFMYKRYGLPIIVTENGYSDNDSVCLDGKVHDPQRTDFIYRYLGGVKRAISEGIPVIGYQYWSLMDNFEWAEGYSPRFGLIYIDFETQERILKDSAYEYKKIIETNGDCI